MAFYTTKIMLTNQTYPNSVEQNKFCSLEQVFIVISIFLPDRLQMTTDHL